jgi:hypothetical protein
MATMRELRKALGLDLEEALGKVAAFRGCGARVDFAEMLTRVEAVRQDHSVPSLDLETAITRVAGYHG